jgi:hypothetical protein
MKDTRVAEMNGASLEEDFWPGSFPDCPSSVQNNGNSQLVTNVYTGSPTRVRTRNERNR